MIGDAVLFAVSGKPLFAEHDIRTLRRAAIAGAVADIHDGIFLSRIIQHVQAFAIGGERAMFARERERYVQFPAAECRGIGEHGNIADAVRSEYPMNVKIQSVADDEQGDLLFAAELGERDERSINGERAEEMLDLAVGKCARGLRDERPEILRAEFFLLVQARKIFEFLHFAE